MHMILCAIRRKLVKRTHDREFYVADNGYFSCRELLIRFKSCSFCLLNTQAIQLKAMLIWFVSFSQIHFFV